MMRKILTNKILITSFVISAVYWTYLFFFSDMLIVLDAIAYEKNGRLIHEAGWITFFETGPHREPFYPLLISVSIGLSDMLNIPYIAIQKVIQISFLLSTQVLTLCILTKMRIHSVITSAVILYLGISPALVNSAFSLWSEIATYPFVLGVILVSAYSWRLIFNVYSPKILLAGVGLSFLFAVLALTKGVFEYVFLIYSIPFFVILLWNIFKRNNALSISSAIFLAVLFFGFYSCTTPYKSFNHKYNGNFGITNARGATVLYGAVARRSQKINPRKLQAYLASIPGDGVCRSFFSEQECFYWSFITADQIAAYKVGKLSTDYSQPEIQALLMRLARDEFFKNPLANILFATLEGFKIFFWESTNIGFVVYPPLLTKVFQFPIFKNLLRLSVSLLTVISVFYSIFYVWWNRSLIGQVSHKRIQMLFFCLILAGSFTGLYSLCYILTRYAFPIVPLFIVCIAVFADQVILPVIRRAGTKS